MQPEQQEEIEKAKLRLFLVKSDKGDKALDTEGLRPMRSFNKKIGKIDLKASLKVSRSYTIYSFDGNERFVLSEFKDTISCYNLEPVSQVIPEVMKSRTHQLQVYKLSADKSAWELANSINLSLKGRFSYGLRFIRTFTKDVAFLTYGTGNLYLHVLAY